MCIFALAGHDPRRAGFRIGLALDHPGRLSKLAVPRYPAGPMITGKRMNRLYALKIYHWTFFGRSHIRCRRR